MKRNLQATCLVTAFAIGILGALAVPAMAQTQYTPELKHDIHELEKARQECAHVRETLHHAHDKYAFGGDLGKSEAALTQLEHDIDAAKEVVKQQVSQGK